MQRLAERRKLQVKLKQEGTLIVRDIVQSYVKTYGSAVSTASFNETCESMKTYKFKGSYNNGSLALKLAKATLASTDAGQTLAATASGSDASYSFKITAQDASDAYFTGKVMSFMTNTGSVNSILGAEVKIEIDSDIVETT